MIKEVIYLEYVLRTNNLRKSYKGKAAVDGINLNICRGDIYGFLGENGAGKTTTIRMLMGLITPTSGSIEIFGRNLSLIKSKEAYLEKIGSVIEFPGFYPNLTAAENLDIQRRLMGMSDKKCIEENLELMGLLESRNKKVKNFSLGMKQRLGIARAMLHNPELLILDEPTNGLDPAGIKEIRKLILNLNSKNITVLISSHILSEIDKLANKIGIMHKGKLLEEIDYESLQKKNRCYLELKTKDDKKASLILEQKLGINDFAVPESGIIKIYEKLDASDEIIRTLVLNNVSVKELSVTKDNLESYFLKLTGGEAHV